MKYAILFPLLFILQNISIKETDAFLQGKFRFDIRGRPDMPSVYPPLHNYNVELTRQGAGKDYPVKVSRHHIIPANKLTQFYNKLVKNGEAFKLRSFWTKFNEKFAQFYRQKAINEGNQHHYEEIIKNVNEFVEGLYYGKIVYDPNARVPQNFDEFESYYAWLLGNLFIGPSPILRSDDPGQDFETNAKSIVGARQFNNLNNVYNLMESYIAGSRTNIVELSKGLRDIANILEPQALRSSDWVLDKNGKYKIKKYRKEDEYDEYLHSDTNYELDSKSHHVEDFSSSLLFNVLMD